MKLLVPAIFGAHVLLAVTIMPSQPEARSSAVMSDSAKHKKPYSDFGDDNAGPRCNNQWMWPGNCPGSLPGKKQRDSAALAKWIKRVSWRKESFTIDRIPLKEGDPHPVLTISGIRDAQDISLKKLGPDTLLIARITTESPVKDQFYQVYKGALPQGGVYTGDFYLFIEGFNPSADSSPPPVSRKISHWFVKGLVVKGRDTVLVNTGRNGNLRWCGDAHENRDVGAGFTSCEGMMRVDQLQRLVRSNPEYLRLLNGQTLLKYLQNQASLTSRFQSQSFPRGAAPTGVRPPEAATDPITTLALKILTDMHSDPAWMICGVGCCTADDAQQ